MEHAEAKARTHRRPGGLHTQRHWIELDLPHPARSPPAWCETLSGLAGLAEWHCSDDIVGASQDARAEWRRRAAVLFDESLAGRVASPARLWVPCGIGDASTRGDRLPLSNSPGANAFPTGIEARSAPLPARQVRRPSRRAPNGGTVADSARSATA